MLKGISGNKHTSHFAFYNSRRDWTGTDYETEERDLLYDRGGRGYLLRPIIDRLPTSVQRHFFIDEYIDVDEDTYEDTYPCIRRSASGESTNSIVVAYSSLVVVHSSLVSLQ